ncbi:hypothetical protein [Micromonospora haikouensis]|uniref:hypothetical protein n=1 Tax=Micromonospora haikouensis TaxID=686309 RepID=UPI003D754516
MSITVVPVPQAHSNLLPGNRHQYGPNSRIVGADMQRVAMTVVVPVEDSDARADLERYLLEEHRRPGRPYGLALLETQLMGLMLVTGVEEIEAFRAGRVALPVGPQAVVYGGWPSCGHGPWEDIIPATTWHPGGVGVLDEYDGVDGARVTLYEFTIDEGLAWNRHGTPTGKTLTMVSWHCDRCHLPYDFDLGERMDNRGPDDRGWMSRNARVHASGRDGRCRPPTGEMERVVAAVASEMRGQRVELPSPEATCAAEEGCSRVRLARATTARLLAGATS